MKSPEDLSSSSMPAEPSETPAETVPVTPPVAAPRPPAQVAAAVVGLIAAIAIFVLGTWFAVSQLLRAGVAGS